MSGSDEGAGDALQVDLKGLVGQCALERPGREGEVCLGALADGGVIDGVEAEGAGQVLGEAGVGGVCLNVFEGDGGAGCLTAGGRIGVWWS